VGASIAMGNNAGIDLLRAIVTPAAPPVVSSTKLRPRLIEGSKRSLLAVFNDTPQDQTANVIVPPRYHRATDIHSQKVQPWEKGAVQVSVPYEDVVVLVLE
jgi:hypothetical protein